MWPDSKAGRKGQEAGSEAEVMFEARLNPSGLTQMEKCVDVIESRFVQSKCNKVGCFLGRLVRLPGSEGAGGDRKE